MDDEHVAYVGELLGCGVGGIGHVDQPGVDRGETTATRPPHFLHSRGGPRTLSSPVCRRPPILVGRARHSRSCQNSSVARDTRTVVKYVLGALALVAMLGLAPFFLASGLMAPGWAVVVFSVIWLALFVLGCLWIRRKPLWVIPLPFVAAAIWLGGIAPVRPGSAGLPEAGVAPWGSRRTAAKIARTPARTIGSSSTSRPGSWTRLAAEAPKEPLAEHDVVRRRLELRRIGGAPAAVVQEQHPAAVSQLDLVAGRYRHLSRSGTVADIEERHQAHHWSHEPIIHRERRLDRGGRVRRT